MTGIQSKIRLVGGQMRSEINRMLESIQDLYAFPTDTSIDETVKITNRKHIHRQNQLMRRSLPTTVKSFPLIFTAIDTSEVQFPETVLKFGGGLLKGGNGQFYMGIDDHSILKPTDEISVACWFYTPTYFTIWDNTIISKQNSYELSVSTTVSGVAKLQIYNGSSMVTVTTAVTSVSKNTWHHIVATYKSGTGGKIYIDGVLGETPITYTGAMSANTNQVWILNNYNGNETIPQTKIAWLTLLHKEVDQTWVTNHYNGLLDTSGTNNEIFTLPFVGDYLPYPDATSGLCRSG